MRNPLEHFWPVVDASESVITADSIRTWSQGASEALRDCGLIQFVGTSHEGICPGCDEGHREEVIVREAPGGGVRYFIPCPQSLRVELSPDDLQRWAIHFEELPQRIATALSLRGRLTVREPRRLWRLGRTKWQQGLSRDVLFARGLCWSDAAEIARQISRTTRPIVLVPDQVPEDSLWTKRIPPVVALSDVSQLCDGELEIDRDDLFAAIQDQDHLSAITPAEAIDKKELKLMIQRQVKAESKAQLTDDLVVAAYIREGSSRKAADALAKDGYSIDHSTVARIVKKSQDSIARDSSESIVRTVASQRRDGKKKISNRPEAVDWE